MHPLKRDADALAGWYHKSVRQFLQRVEPERVAEFDGDLQRLAKTHERLDAELAACFLGSSGVGKSTLINALVAGHEQCVPAGGVGPLTAQALTVRFGDKPAFRATYHPAQKLNQLSFALQQSFKSELVPAVESVSPLSEGDGGLRADSEVADFSESAEDSRTHADRYRKQAQLMITGCQNGEADVAYLIDGLRLAMGQRPLFGKSLTDDDANRVERLRRRLSGDDLSRCYSSSKTSDEPGFHKALEEHATGFLAPLISKLEVEWPCPLLSQGLALVDLPGLGIDGDAYREVTRRWITERAKAVVLVVDHRGVTEANAQLLRTSGFLNRLLHSAYDVTADPATLIVVVVQIDNIASERRATDKSKSKLEHFADVRQESLEYVRGNIRTQLENAWSLSGDAPTEAKRQVIEHIVEHLKIHSVSAIQYRMLLAQDEDDTPFIKQPRDSGIPELIAGLGRMAEDEKEERRLRLSEALGLLGDRLYSALELIQSRWQSDLHSTEEAERLRGELMAFLQPLREEFRVRQGAFREFLKETLPQRIEGLVTNAKVTAGKSIRAALRNLRDAHWKTLQAAVRRGGTYNGAKHIELPRDFALTFEEPIAEVWGESVLKQIRERTSQFADDCVALVDQVVAWANDQGTRVRPKMVAAQRDAIRTDAKRLKTVGREMVNELREEVTTKLVQAIEPPIRRKCEAFVKKNQHVGTGVRNRILELFDELAEDTLEAAVKPAQKILLECYGQVEAEIREVFNQHQDPLHTAAEAVVESHESRVRRSDAQQRNAILEELRSILADRPVRSLDQPATATTEAKA